MVLGCQPSEPRIGGAADFIRPYTSAQIEIRLGGTAPNLAAIVQESSDAIATAVYNEILGKSSPHDSDMNRAFIAAINALDDPAPLNWASVGAYDGAHLIYEMVEAAGSDGPAAVEHALGLEWESPRGPLVMDPDSRTVGRL